MDDAMPNDWLALFVDPALRATRVQAHFAAGEPINEAITFDAAILASRVFGAQEVTGTLTMLDGQGQTVRSGTLRFDADMRRWRADRN